VHILGVNSDLDFQHDICQKLLQGRIAVVDDLARE